MLYPLMIAVGLFLGTLAFMVDPPKPRLVMFALGAVCFLVGSGAAAGVVH